MWRRLIRAGIAGSVLVGLVLSSAPGVFAATEADLSVALTGPTRIKSGGFYEYTITVTNHGPDTATHINIMGGGGDQIDHVSVFCQDNGSFGQSQCFPSDLAPGASTTAIYTLRVSGLVRGESRDAVVGASAGQDYADTNPDPNLDNNQAQLTVFIYGRLVR